MYAGNVHSPLPGAARSVPFRWLLGGCWPSSDKVSCAMATLTKRTVEVIKPAASVTYVWDDQLAGFGLKVLPDGRRRYIVKYRVKGRAQRPTTLVRSRNPRSSHL